MTDLITTLAIINFMLFVAWIVALRVQRDREYAARVRAENERKSILRGDND